MITNSSICPACDNVAGLVGTLGWAAWYSCQHCGVWFSKPITKEDLEEEDDDVENS